MTTANRKKGKGDSGWGPWPWILGLLLVAMVGAMVYRNTQSDVVTPEARADAQAKKTKEAQDRAKAGAPEGTQFLPDEGQSHVETQVRVAYKTDPPTSGQHWGTWAKAGFHDEAPAAQMLVHNLEHGNVIIYYDKAKLPAADLEKIRQLAGKYQGQWDGVLAVPRTDAENPVVLTAWQSMLKLPAWDQAKAEKFVAAFRGRGPERPIR